MPREILEPKEFSKLASSVERVTIVWYDDFAKVKARVGSILYTCKMPLDVVQRFLSSFKGGVDEVNQKPESVKPRRSRRRKAGQVSEGQGASASSQEASK